MVTETLPNPVVHIPLYCSNDTPDYCVRYLVEQVLVCLESYFAHRNPYDVLVTTNDCRVLRALSCYRERSGHLFTLRRVGGDELLDIFGADERCLADAGCIRTIFSKFYPVVSRASKAIVHVDIDTMFLSKVDFGPLLASSVGLVDANRIDPDMRAWRPTRKYSDFFSIPLSATPVATWLNTGVFAVCGDGLDLCRAEVRHYLENLAHAIADGIHGSTDESIMNALAVREPERVRVIPDYRYNFLAYYLERDPTWKWQGKIVHFHSLKPYEFYFDGVVRHRCNPFQAKRINPELYLAVLIWCRYLHTACERFDHDFPMISAMPREVVLKELDLMESICLARAALCANRNRLDAGFNESVQTERMVGRMKDPIAVL